MINMDPLEVWKKDSQRLEIYQDDIPESPREWDNLGIMLCTHREYDLGDEQFNTAEELEERVLELEPIVKLPLWLLDHSGLAMQTGEFASDAQHWDSGQVGWIVVSKDAAADHMGSTKPIEEILENEVSIYSKYLSGDILMYHIYEDETCPTCKNTTSNSVDSCGGFYDTESIFDNIDEDGWVQQ